MAGIVVGALAATVFLVGTHDAHEDVPSAALADPQPEPEPPFLPADLCSPSRVGAVFADGPFREVPSLERPSNQVWEDSSSLECSWLLATRGRRDEVVRVRLRLDVMPQQRAAAQFARLVEEPPVVPGHQERSQGRWPDMFERHHSARSSYRSEWLIAHDYEFIALDGPVLARVTVSDVDHHPDSRARRRDRRELGATLLNTVPPLLDDVRRSGTLLPDEPG